MNLLGAGCPEVFDAQSDSYEEGVLKWASYFPPAWIAKHVHALTGLPEWRVLDMGCGTGLNVKLLCEQRTGIRADGVDSSPQMINRARASGRYESLYTHDLNKTVPDIPSNTFDLVIAFGFLEFLSDVHPCLSECCRALKMNGKLWASFRRFEAGDEASPPRRTLFGDAQLPVIGYSASEIIHVIGVLGMRLIALEPVIGYITAMGFPCPYYVLQAEKMGTSTRDEHDLGRMPDNLPTDITKPF